MKGNYFFQFQTSLINGAQIKHRRALLGSLSTLNLNKHQPYLQYPEGS